LKEGCNELSYLSSEIKEKESVFILVEVHFRLIHAARFIIFIKTFSIKTYLS
jgi:hypothetical protein